MIEPTASEHRRAARPEAHQPAVTDVGESIAAWRQTMTALIELGDAFSTSQWDARTECPQWSVKDIYAHLVGGEEWMSEGHPPPSTGLAAIADEPVIARRGATGAAVLAELREVFARRQAELAAQPPDPDQPTQTAFGLKVTVGILLSHRAFDAWVHEQDVRRAVGRPGNLGSASAHIARDIFLLSLARVVAKLAAAPLSSVVRVRVEGEVAFDHVVRVDANGRGQLGDWSGEDLAAQLRMDWETYARLAAGRVPPTAAAVTITGDRDLAGRILARFAVTP